MFQKLFFVCSAYKKQLCQRAVDRGFGRGASKPLSRSGNTGGERNYVKPLGIFGIDTLPERLFLWGETEGFTPQKQTWLGKVQERYNNQTSFNDCIMMQISQGHLNTLDYCPRLFQHIYLDQLSIPLTFEQQEAMARGSRFHTLMQQHEMGLSTQVLGEDAALSELMARFLAAAPDVMRRDRALFRQSEHRRQIVFQDFLITVIYDLLILEPEHADILDWKTGLGLPSTQKLERNWQFKLYPFVLAKTSTYPPEHITMTYWFVQPGGLSENSSPQMLRFSYTSQKHEAIAQELSHRLTLLNQYLDDYRAGRSLPQIDDGEGHCGVCPFAVRCDRGPTRRSPDITLPDLNDIHEVRI